MKMKQISNEDIMSALHNNQALLQTILACLEETSADPVKAKAENAAECRRRVAEIEASFEIKRQLP